MRRAGGGTDGQTSDSLGGPKKTDSTNVGGQTPGKTDPAGTGTKPQTTEGTDSAGTGGTPINPPTPNPGIEGLEYELNETKDGYVVSGIGECRDTDIGIPATHEGLPVTVIGDYAFKDCTGLTSITIPDSVTEIGGTAFWGCTSLTSITISDSVTEIGDAAFRYCGGLTSITVDDGNPVYHSAGNCLIETKDKTLIAGCKTSVIPNDGSITAISDAAFEGCTGLTSITIPSSVTEIGDAAFRDCTGLTSITIPDSVTAIGSSAFHDCAGLTSITIPGGVTEIGGWTFYGCTGLTSITIPDGVTEIGNFAFYECTGLTRITISDSVTGIGDGAFRGCGGLTSVTIPDSVTAIGDGAFRGCGSLTSITVAEGNLVYHSAGNCLIETKEKTLIVGCKTSVIPNDGSVTAIGDSAFDGCTGLTSITIPGGVTAIGDLAFAGCTGLTSITVSEGNPVYHSTGNCLIETESKTLVAGCKTSVIPDDGSVTSIGENAFYRCMSLTSITIPNSVTEIGEYAFSECYSLTDIYYAGTEAQWAELAEEAEVPETATVHYNSKG